MKKLVIAAVLGFIAVSALSNTKLGSYLSIWWDNVTKSAKEKISLETELARIKKEVSKLDRDIDKAKSELAEANVASRKMKKEVEDLTKAVAENELAVKERGEILKKADDKSMISWGVRTVNYSQAKNLLLEDVKRHNTLKDNLKFKQAHLESVEQNREACEANWQELVKQKSELALLVTELEAEIQKEKVERNRVKKPSEANNRVSDIRMSAEEIRTRLEISREKRRLEGGQPSVTATVNPTANLSVDQILSGLQQPAAPAEGKLEVKVIEK